MSRPGIEIKVVGLEKVLQALAKQIREIPERNNKGIIKGGFVILRAAQQKCPVQYGNLKASGFLVWPTGNVGASPAWKNGATKKNGMQVQVDTGRMNQDHASAMSFLRDRVKEETKNKGVGIGFSAYYALYVHENIEASHRVGEARFLQNAVKEQSARVLKIIASEARKK